MKTTDLKCVALIYACARQMGGSDDEFKALSVVGVVSFAHSVLVAAKIATWYSGKEWRAACPGQDGYFDEGLYVASHDGIPGDSPTDAGMRAYLLQKVGENIADIPQWVIGYKP